MHYKQWIEHAKTITLTIFILLSFILTGYLLYSAPSFEESRQSFLQPPFIGDEKNNKQSVYELVSPHQLITHQLGDHAYTLPNETTYRALFALIREAELTNFSVVTPTPEHWEKIFQGSHGVEIQFLHDSSIGQLDAFFKLTTLREQPLIKNQTAISRIFFFIDPKTDQLQTWFVSDQYQMIVEAETEGIDLDQLRRHISGNTAIQTNTVRPIATNNKLPWDKENKDIDFSPIIYLPEQSRMAERFTYQLSHIDIETMKQWLFKDPDVAPVQLNNHELLYMYNDPNMYNDQIITYNKQKNAMVYTNAPTMTENENLLIREELNEINQFIQRHRGWTNFYLLDQIQTEAHATEYIFRLFVNHLPVYRSEKATTEIQPDTIQFQVKNSSISKYVRSMYYLPKNPTQKKEEKLPDQKEILSQLKQKKIAISRIKQIYPGYQTKQNKNQITLYPVWVVETLDGKTHFLSSPSQKGE